MCHFTNVLHQDLLNQILKNVLHVYQVQWIQQVSSFISVTQTKILNLLCILGSDTKLPNCQTQKDLDCALGIIQREFSPDICPKSCSRIQYSGRVDHWDQKEKNDRIAILNIGFSSPEKVKVFEEYLIHDTIEIIGIVGGTLGLFFGFDFYRAFVFVVNHCRNFNFRRK